MTLHRLTEEVTGPVLARLGDLLEVHVVENAGTGHLWEVARLPAGMVEVDVESLTGSAAPGAASLRVFTVRADAAGRGQLRLELRRPWEDEPLRAVTWAVTVAD